MQVSIDKGRKNLLRRNKGYNLFKTNLNKMLWKFYMLQMKYGVSEGIRTPDPQDHNLVL